MIEIAPSILAADFTNLSRDIAEVEKAGADVIHLDIMDGHFVPNITIGPPVVSSIRKITSLPLDAHLMIEEPSRYLDVLIQAGVNWISVHLEADTHLERTVSYLRERGIRAGVALNPATPIAGLEEILPEVDSILLMTVNPGFGGQRFISATLKKIRKLRELISCNGYKARIEVDGGIGADNLQEILTAGAEIIVMGSAIFGANRNVTEAMAEIRAITERHLQLLT